jgi:phosphatidylglycerol:prolipoprotein diacylglycerol transferase
MIPPVLRISISSALPRVLTLTALFVLLLAAALALLVGATKKVVIGALGAAAMVTALVIRRSDARPVMIIQASPFGLCLCCGIILAGYLIFRSARSVPLPRDTTALRISGALLGGLFGARLGYWLLIDGSSTGWRDIANFRHGGLLGFGAYLGGALATVCIIREDWRTLARWLDHITKPLLLGIAITRVGCYLEGSDFGRPLPTGASPLLVALGTFPRWQGVSGDSYFGSPAWANQVAHWGLSTDATVSLPVHPVQLYEVAFVLAILLVLSFKKHERPVGALFVAVAVSYSLGYVLLGFLRGDLTHVSVLSTRWRWSLPLGSHEQLVALGACALALMVWRSWKHEQAFCTRFKPLFRAAKTKLNT